ncbi:MAG: polymer-forming cytoskeletal protein, partial [Candidatus Latescibacteria bacterium]|nr:polymer-forming cytoskeletal protein [Candidatus Latescibacterota bacterium]
EAEEKVHLQAQAAFIGKLKTRLLIVEEGAIFKAECDAGAEMQVSEPAPEAMVEAASAEGENG